MLRILFSIILIGFLVSDAFSSSTFPQDKSPNINTVKELNHQQLTFTENQGQWDDDVLFQAKAGRAKMWFALDGAYYQFTRQLMTTEMAIEIVFGSDEIVDSRPSPLSHNLHCYDYEKKQLESIMIKSSFVGANPEPRIIGLEEMKYKCNYFIGSDSNKWYTDVPNYQAIQYEDIYPGIDLKYYSTHGKLEYDIIASPGADLTQIQIKYEGTRSVNINESGELVIETDWGKVIERQPYIYQELEGQRFEIAGEYTLVSENIFSFRLSNDYNPQFAVVIDPVLTFGTFLGGSNIEECYDIEVDDNGYVYVVCVSHSSDFPTFNPFQVYQGGNFNVVFTKLSSTGEGLIYSSYLGEEAYGTELTIDNVGNIYLVGSTISPNFPTLNSLQTFQGDSDAFITKINSSGNALMYSTFLGGSSWDAVIDIEVDITGIAYLTGQTQSPNFPTLNSFQDYQSYNDVFVTVIDSNCSNILFSTLIGGQWDDSGNGIALDSKFNIYVVGITASQDFPLINHLQEYQSPDNGFILKFSSKTYELIFSTYWGGNNDDYCLGIAVDSEDNAYIAGYTGSNDFQIVNPYQETFMGGWYDGFITKINGNSYDIIYSTYLGENREDRIFDIAVDIEGNAYVTGFTQSTNFPTLHSWQTKHGLINIFITKLNNFGDDILFSTFLGGSGQDFAWGIDLDTLDNIYVAGNAYSEDFPVLNSFQQNSGFSDAFVVKFSPYVCGNVDGMGFIDISDVVYLIAYLFSGGPAPEYLQAGDADCDGEVGLTDAVYLINYIFIGGQTPCEICEK